MINEYEKAGLELCKKHIIHPNTYNEICPVNEAMISELMNSPHGLITLSRYLQSYVLHTKKKVKRVEFGKDYKVSNPCEERIKTLFDSVGVTISDDESDSDNVVVKCKLFSSSVFIALKMIREYTQDDTGLNEYAVGLKLNELREYTPNFAYVFGIFSALFNKSIHMLSVKQLLTITNHKMNWIMYEYIAECISLQEYIENIKEENMTEFYSIIKQVLLSLQIAYDKLSFVHHDFHMNNILVQKLHEERELKYTIRGNVYVVKTKILVKIIDYGLSSIVVNNRICGVLGSYAAPQKELWLNLPGIDTFVFVAQLFNMFSPKKKLKQNPIFGKILSFYPDTPFSLSSIFSENIVKSEKDRICVSYHNCGANWRSKEALKVLSKNPFELYTFLFEGTDKSQSTVCPNLADKYKERLLVRKFFLNNKELELNPRCLSLTDSYIINFHLLREYTQLQKCNSSIQDRVKYLKKKNLINKDEYTDKDVLSIGKVIRPLSDSQKDVKLISETLETIWDKQLNYPVNKLNELSSEYHEACDTLDRELVFGVYHFFEKFEEYLYIHQVLQKIKEGYIEEKEKMNFIIEYMRRVYDSVTLLLREGLMIQAKMQSKRLYNVCSRL